jgi:DNA-binding MarR family transcriptional regulator
MTRLSDTQLVILTAAAQRADLSVLPLPETLKLKGGALKKVMDSLRNKGLIRVIETDGRPQRLVLTSEGMAAIGVALNEQEDQTAAPAKAETAPTPADAGTVVEAPGSTTEADSAATPAKRKAKAKVARPGKAAPTEKPTPRSGTKQALMIEMLKRPEGATVEQIAAATDWQRHTIRGAISGALKKKLGLTVEATRSREVGPNKTGAKGSTTVYRITGSGPETSNGSSTGTA